ncbi:MAG: hypothetical protein WD874_01745 [Parcubacteria group bacterium]
MNKTIGAIIILVFIVGAGIAFFQEVLVKPGTEGEQITTGGTNTAPTTPTDTTSTSTSGQVVNPPVSAGPCYIGGCSSQICSDEEGMMSTCEYREEYACYKTAKCERQVNGQCGWTETATLRMCIEEAD